MSIALSLPTMSMPDIDSLTVALEPVQENDYDSVWPAGGGKNLYAGVQAIQEKNGVTIEATPDGEIWVHGEPNIASGYINFSLGRVISERALNQTVTASINEKTVGVGITFGSTGALNFTLADTATTKTANYGSALGDCNINVRYDVGNINKKYKIQIELGSTATSWTPYSNICPITGHSEVTVTRTGKNLLDTYEEYSWTPSLTKNADGSIKVVGMRTSNGIKEIGSIALRANTTYTLSKSGNQDLYYQMQIDGLTVGTAALADLTYTPTEDATAIIRVFVRGNVDFNEVLYPQIELGTTTSYEPYQGETYDITFPAEVGTVYGGTLDVLTGVLTVDRAMVDLGTLNWSNETFVGQAGFKAIGLSGGKSIGGYNGIMEKAVCSIYSIGSNGSMSVASSDMKVAVGAYYRSGCNVYVRDSRFTYAADFKTAVTGQTLVYELATPTTVQLTAHEVETLTGINNVWSDSGDVTVTISGTTQTGDVVTFTALPQHKIQLFKP